MTQEDKQLLLKDLCARLPYGVKINHTIYNWEGACINFNRKLRSFAMEKDNGLCYDVPVEEIRPYLRPMSSMTEKEKDELCKLCDFEKSYDDEDYFTHYCVEIISEYCVNGKKIPESVINYNVIDFFYGHHLDWRGLIPMGLALEAPEGMYKL